MCRFRCRSIKISGLHGQIRRRGCGRIGVGHAAKQEIPARFRHKSNTVAVAIRSPVATCFHVFDRYGVTCHNAHGVRGVATCVRRPRNTARHTCIGTVLTERRRNRIRILGFLAVIEVKILVCTPYRQRKACIGGFTGIGIIA